MENTEKKYLNYECEGQLKFVDLELNIEEEPIQKNEDAN
jgi:hypothetical protein